MTPLAGKAALVTGASRGIGRAIARRLVAVHYGSNETAARKTLRLIAESIETITPEAFDRLIAVNTKAPLFIIQRALPLPNDGGRIIDLSTAATRIAVPEQPYAMSKAAVEVLSRSLALLLGGRGITVNAVAPGPTVTDMNPWMLDDPEVQQAVGTGNAIPRAGRPGDVVAFPASEAGRWVTGRSSTPPAAVSSAPGSEPRRPGCQRPRQDDDGPVSARPAIVDAITLPVPPL